MTGIPAQPTVEQRLTVALAEGSGTTRTLARRAGCDPGYAREILAGMMHRGLVTRWKMTGTRAMMWRAL